MTLLVLYVSLALGVSFLCSLYEAVLLSTRLVWLVQLRADGSRGAAMLLDLKQQLFSQKLLLLGLKQQPGRKLLLFVRFTNHTNPRFNDIR